MKDLLPLVQVLLAIRAGAFVRGTEQFEGGHQLPALPVADFQVWLPAHIHRRYKAGVSRRLDGLHALDNRARWLRGDNRHIRPAQDDTLLVGRLVNVDVYRETEALIFHLIFHLISCGPAL